MLGSSKWASAPETSKDGASAATAPKQTQQEAATETMAVAEPRIPSESPSVNADPADSAPLYNAYPSYDDPPQPPAEDDLFDDDDDDYEGDYEVLAAPDPQSITAADNYHIASKHAQADDAAGSIHVDQAPVGEFAQSRPPDDLFSDDFTPNAEPTVEHPVIAPSSGAPIGAPTGPRNANRGRGGRGRANGPVARQHQPREIVTPAEPKPTDESTATPAAPGAPRTQPVRGDRLATGGNARPKLTEEQLSERMAAIKLKNVSLEAAHARASADEAAFAQRELEAKAAAAERAKEERQNRQQMMGEREKNRARKLKSMASRDWEAGKEEREAEEDARRGKGFKRGAHGGVLWEDRNTATASASAGAEQAESYGARGGHRGRGRGRGGRGGSAGRGGKQGDAAKSESVPTKQSPPTDTDFPALGAPAGTSAAAPTASAAANDTPTAKATPNTTAPLDTQSHKAKPSWADQMESPTVAKA